MELSAISIKERFNHALQLERNGQFPDALLAYEGIVKDDRRFKDAYINLGSLYSRMSRIHEAIECFTNALAIAEDHISHFNLGCIYYKNGDYKKAILSLDRSKQLRGDFSIATQVMGLSFSKLKNYRAAETCFTEILSQAPDNRVALTALAIIHYEKRQFQQSLDLINQLLLLDPGNHSVRKLRARTLYGLDRLNESAVEVKQIRESMPEYRLFDEFVRKIPVEIYTDKYGTIDEKIERVRNRAKKSNDRKDLISLSLCHMLKGDTGIAIDYLFEAKKRNLH